MKIQRDFLKNLQVKSTAGPALRNMAEVKFFGRF